MVQLSLDQFSSDIPVLPLPGPSTHPPLCGLIPHKCLDQGEHRMRNPAGVLRWSFCGGLDVGIQCAVAVDPDGTNRSLHRYLVVGLSSVDGTTKPSGDC